MVVGVEDGTWTGFSMPLKRAFRQIAAEKNPGKGEGGRDAASASMIVKHFVEKIQTLS